MQTEAVGSSELAVVAGDVLALRGAGLAAPETWALLCQAAQALQDLFLSNGGVVDGSGVGPVVTPHTLELTPRGRVTLQLASPETARAYLPPEYRPGRVYSDTDSEKMWMYSLGRALLDTTPRISALTGSVSVSPPSALQSVLSAMTEPDPHRRASLMNLLDVISEYCRTRLQSKPFTHIVMDMYREVMRSPQYGARKQAAFPVQRSMLPPTQRPHQRQNQQRQVHSQQHAQHSQYQNQHPIQQHQPTGHFSKHQIKGAIFKAQSRNSRSHPNLHSLSGQEPSLSNPKPQFQSQMNIQASNVQAIHHARTSSQPEYSERVQRGLTGNTRSTHNLMFSNGQSTSRTSQPNNLYSDPIYALPVKPFLSSQDVRVNGLSTKSTVPREDFYGQTVTGRPRTIKNGGLSHPNIAHLARASNIDGPLGHTNDIRGKGSIGRNSQPLMSQLLQRQYSNPQLPTRNLQESGNGSHAYSRSNDSSVPTRLRVFTGDNKIDGVPKNDMQNNLVSSMKVPSLHGPVPPKPPRVMNTLKRSAAPLPQSNNGLNVSVAPAKPPRLAIKNGPRARRGKPVQRAPSRLYRTIGGPTRCFNKNQCVGPEFVVRANQPPKILCVGDAKANSSGRIVVILLTGQRVEVTCDPQKIVAGELLQAIVQAEGLDENFTLGLAALLAGDFAMLPPETKLNKVAPPGWLNGNKNKGTLGLPTSFMLYLRLRFFLPSLRGTRSWVSKHLLYLQIRRCILEQQLVCPLVQLVNLTGFALQAEFGNYNVNEHGRGDYFLLEHYIPESLILNPDHQQQQTQLPGGAEVLRARLHQAHRDRRGLDASSAEEMFITHAQALPDYGSHYYIATADSKELSKVIERLKKANSNRSPSVTTDGGLYDCTENIYKIDGSSECPIYGKIEFNHVNSSDNVQRSVYTDERKLRGDAIASKTNDDVYAVPTGTSVVNLVEANNNSNSNNNKLNKSRKSESNVWLAIHAQGLKLFERGGRPRDRNELARLQWRDIQTLSYSKNSLVVYTRFNGKRCKFKLRMDHKKSYYAFKLTSLHHQFFLKLRSELTSLHGLAKDFGIPLMVEPVSAPLKLVPDPSKPKTTITNVGKNISNPKYPMQLEEFQNKENENPQKVINPLGKSEDMDAEPVCYTPEEDALYAQVNARLEPEGASRDTEDESDRALASRTGHVVEMIKQQRTSEEEKLYSYPSQNAPCVKESLYSIPKATTSNEPERIENEVKHPEELYAAINKPGHNKKNSDYPVPDEVWDIANPKKNLNKVKTSSLPNYGTPRQSTGFRTPSLPRRLGVKMGTRAIYSTVVQRDSDITDDLESLSIKSDTASSIQSASARSNDSPLPEAYVLNADIRTDDETFRVGNDDTMSASLVARLEELSFAEERILHTIQLERGHGGSIGLQVTEGNDGGVYVQAVSVGGSADMAGNVNKGDRIVAINGQSLLNLRYDEALKMLQSSSETVELVLSQVTSNRLSNFRRERLQEPKENNYLHNLRFEISSEAETSSMTTKWLSARTTDVASVQNTSSAYSSAASSSMGNHNTNNMYPTDVSEANALNSASMLLSLSDFDVSLEISAPPPVPPRRRKRITNNPAPSKPVTATRTVLKEDKTSTNIENKRPDRKPRSLPPPPPLPRCAPRGRKFRSAGNLTSETTDNSRSNNVRPASGDVNLPSTSTILESLNTGVSPRFIVTKVADIEEQPIREKSDVEELSLDHCSSFNVNCQNENLSGRSSPAPHRYSPLLFTFNDFESVMADSGICDKSVNEQFESIVKSDETAHTLITSFIESSAFEDHDEDTNDEQVCFRVTTTNVPFEKCLDDWNISNDNGEFDEKFDVAENHYIFEDYMCRNKRFNARSAAAAFVFDDENFNKEPVSFRTATKVRFVFESPSCSTPDLDLDDTNGSNFQAVIVHDEVIKKPSVIITDVTESERIFDDNEETSRISCSDEFGDVPFSSLIENELKANNDINFSEMKHGEPTLNEVENDEKFKTVSQSVESKNCDNPNRRRSSPSPRFTSPKKTEFHPIDNIEDILMPTLPPTYDPREEGFVRKQWNLKTDVVPETLDDDKGSTCLQLSDEPPTTSESSRNARKAFVSGKLKMDSQDNGEVGSPIKDDSKVGQPSTGKSRLEDRNIFIDSALRDFLDNGEDDMDWKDSSDDEDGTKKFEDGQDSKPLNLNDCIKIDEPADGGMLNRDTCQEEEASLDNRPRSERAILSEERDSDEKTLSEEPEVKITDSLSLRYSDDTPKLFTDSTNDTKWIPFSVRRNSFLENMLINDDTRGSFETKAPCSIIMAHPKLASNVLVETIEKPSSSLKDLGKSSDTGQVKIAEEKTNERCEDHSKNEVGIRVVGPEPKVVKTMTASSHIEVERKSAAETKNDVLNELLCNFDAIKLKSVEPRIRFPDIDEGAAIVTQVTTDATSGSISTMEEMKSDVVTKNGIMEGDGKINRSKVDSIDSQCSQKNESSMAKPEEATKMKIANDERSSSLISMNDQIHEDGQTVIVGKRVEDSTSLSGNLDNKTSIDANRDKTLDNRDTMISVDNKCAIDRNTSYPQTRCNNNDNNAITPVDVSNDQKSREADVTTIAPGSVRSFVELYEIKREKTSKHSKSNYSIPVAETRSRVKCFKGLWNNADDDTMKTRHYNNEIKAVGSASVKLTEKDTKIKASKIGEIQNGDTMKNEFLESGSIPVAAKRRTQESCLKMNDQLSPRSNFKKTVTFYNDCNSTQLTNKATNKIPFVDTNFRDTDESPKTPKRRAPGRPTDGTRAMEKIHCPPRSNVKCHQELNPSGTRLVEHSKQINPVPLPRTAVNSISTQKHQADIEEDEKDCTVKSGIASSVPKCDVPQLQQPYVFYCRV